MCIRDRCHSKVKEVDGICGECTSGMSMVKLSKCHKKLVVRVKIEDSVKTAGGMSSQCSTALLRR